MGQVAPEGKVAVPPPVSVILGAVVGKPVLNVGTGGGSMCGPLTTVPRILVEVHPLHPLTVHPEGGLLPSVTLPETVTFDPSVTPPFAPTPAPAEMTFVAVVESHIPDATLEFPPPYAPKAELKASVQTPEAPVILTSQ